MNEIICPNCQKAFKIDQAGYADILKQVRNQEFAEELKKRENYFRQDKEKAVQLAQEQLKNLLKDELNQKEKLFLEEKAQKENELNQVKAQMNAFKAEKELAIAEAMRDIQRERDQLEIELAKEKHLKQAELQTLEASYKTKLADEIKLKDAELRIKDELIERYKDMKAKLSTKMLGETLEQHCETEFNKIRPTAFPNVYFQKDNDASGGTKGDYVFRENDAEGNEIISIMFEMKNEADDTSKKQKIESFLKKLHEDRDKKNCEYAVLVTLLEADNELYNTGIVDVSYRYPKMYVIRPQFFITIITLLRNAAMNSLEYKAKLAHIQNQNLDITNFEKELNSFKDAFSKRYTHASERFKDAIDQIDKSIKNLLDVKENLLKSEDHLRIANQKAEDLTIKKLTKGNATMTKLFEDLKGE